MDRTKTLVIGIAIVVLLTTLTSTIAQPTPPDSKTIILPVQEAEFPSDTNSTYDQPIQSETTLQTDDASGGFIDLNENYVEQQPTAFESPIADFFDPISPTNTVAISTIPNSKTVRIASAGIQATTKEALKIDTQGIRVANKAVVLPTIAAANAREKTRLATIKEITLTVVDEKPRYVVKAVQKTNLFGLFPIDLESSTTVNAQTGIVESVEKPWWSFIAWR